VLIGIRDNENIEAIAAMGYLALATKNNKIFAGGDYRLLFISKKVG
jgi:hypothetical protein